MVENYATHKTPEAKAWSEKQPRLPAHFTLTSGSWLNLVEVWFGIIDRQAMLRVSQGADGGVAAGDDGFASSSIWFGVVGGVRLTMSG